MIRHGWRRAAELVDRADELGYEATKAARSVQLAAAAVTAAALYAGAFFLAQAVKAVRNG